MRKFFDTSFTQLNTNKFNIIRNYILLIILLILVIFCLIRINQTTACEGLGIKSILCSDGNDCTNDFLSGNTSCSSLNKFNGSSCDFDEICFNHSLCQPTCELCTEGDCPKPKCVGPRECCNGFCVEDADCEFKVPFATTFNFSCVTGGCIYRIYNTDTENMEDCLNYITDIPLRKCMHATTSDLQVFPNGYCWYYFGCTIPLSGQGPEV